MDHARTVLVVEDEPDLRDGIVAALHRRGYAVVIAGDGRTVTELLTEPFPAVAVVDMLLPGASGFHVTDAIKLRSHGRVPVIMMSGTTSDAHRDYAHATGVDRFLPKPFALTTLLDAVDELCPVGRAEIGSKSDRWH